MMIDRIALKIAAALVLAGVGLPGALAKVKQAGPFCSTEQPWHVRSGEEQTGDRYVLGASGISVDGLQSGDLFGWSPKISIDGELDGDLFAAANSIDISGTVRDSARVFGQNVDIDGTIEGDLVVFAAMLNLKEGSHITGDVFGSAAHFNFAGQVDGEIRLTTGESTIDGRVGRDLRIEADTITLGENARIGGDLVYTSRNELADVPAGIVAGEIIHKDVEDEERDAARDKITVGSVVRWLHWPVAAFIAGAILLALTGDYKLAPVKRLNVEGWTGLAVGLFVLPVVGVAAVVALLVSLILVIIRVPVLSLGLVVTIPVGLIGTVLVVVLAFVGNIPVALWLGRGMLRRAGKAEASPYLCLALGLPVAYVAFSIPYFVGMTLWYVATSAGIGALLLAIVASRQSAEQSSAQA
jgi:cytoskeletal protein CcmA (bactofilin family)